MTPRKKTHLMRSVLILVLQLYGVLLTHNLSIQSAFTCSKLTTETLKQGVKYVQS